VAIAFRSVSVGFAIAGTVDVAKPSGLANGDVLIAFINVEAAVTINTPSGWTGAGVALSVGTQAARTFYKVISNAAGEPANYTFTHTGNTDTRVVVHAYSGVDNTTSQDATAVGQANASSTNVTAPSITTVTADAWVVWLGGYDSGTYTITEPPGTTQRYQAGSGQGARVTSSDYIMATPGATGTKTGTAPTARTNIAVQFALRPAGAGGTTISGSGTSSGVSAASATGAVTTRRTGAGASVGTSIATAVGRTTIRRTATSAATSAALATPHTNRRSGAASVASSNATANGRQRIRRTASSTGDSAGSATGRITIRMAAGSVATATAGATAHAMARQSASSAGVSSATATGFTGTLLTGSATSAGTSSSTAIPHARLHRSASVTGTSTGAATGHASVRSAAVATGTSAVVAIGDLTTRMDGAGWSSGTSAGSAVSRMLWSSAGMAAGDSAAVAVAPGLLMWAEAEAVGISVTSASGSTSEVGLFPAPLPASVVRTDGGVSLTAIRTTSPAQLTATRTAPSAGITATRTGG
jgi:hypothetical protein